MSNPLDELAEIAELDSADDDWSYDSNEEFDDQPPSSRDVIREKIFYDKKMYDRHSYAREYRKRKLLDIRDNYETLYIAKRADYTEDVDGNVFSEIQYGAEFVRLPEELFILIEEILEHQTVYLNLYYPSTLRDICFEQNIFFLETITMPEFSPDTLAHVNFLIPICYVRRFGRRPSENRIQVLFYWCASMFRASDNDERTYEQAFFIDNLRMENIKDSEEHVQTLTNYVLDLQEKTYDSDSANMEEFRRKFKPFEECFRIITLGGV
jgi:hypothetical protein